ncbi:JAB domain-containing protein [Pediococcus pentosaceus]|uniref:JAB domain-containing protein n=1 Tax=Pediococcus pentosaceus TaxID=1255 RepID=UPI002F26737C
MQSEKVKITKKEIIEAIETKKEYIFELGHVLVKAVTSNKPVFKVEGSEQLGKFLSAEIGNYSQEIFKVLYLNIKNEVIYKQELFAGIISTMAVEPFQIIQTAVLVNTPRIIIAHNHPSGRFDEPSQNDITFTQNLNKILKMVGIELIDSIIVSPNSYYSLADNRLLSE